MKRAVLNIFSATIAILLLLVGCGKVTPTDSSERNEHTSSVASVTNSAATKSPEVTTSEATITSNDAIDYNQFVKKVWVVKSRTTNEAYNAYFSFCITKIANGKIEGKFSIGEAAAPDDYFYLPNHLGNLTGITNNDTAECQFSDTDGYNGNITLVFKKSDEIEATIKYTSKSQYNKDTFLDGTFLFRPYNLKDIDGFSPFKNQCFTVDLNSWGNINFVSGKILGGRHIPTVAYLTNKDGDIFYNFTSYIPNNVDFIAVSFKDVNKDGLKDIIIIYGVETDSTSRATKIFVQNTDGLFSVSELTQEINDSGNNKDIKTILDYLSKKS